jgi:hypothetical protein
VVVAKRDVFVALMGILRRTPWSIQCRARAKIVANTLVFFTNSRGTEEILTPLREKHVDNLVDAFPLTRRFALTSPGGKG